MPETFCLCADDYAMTPAVSRGILEALDARLLTATSVMTTSHYWPDAAEPLRRHAGHADIGLHLNLTLGAPLGPMPRLAPHGRLPDIRTLMRMGRRGEIPAAEVGDEIDRQCERFADVFGRAPDHVDGHQHVHVLAAIRPLLFAALQRRGWRPWLRDSGDRFDRLLRRRVRRKALVVSVLADGFAAECARRGFATNVGFAGFSPFDRRRPYDALFRSYVKAPGPRHLVMCHPGHVDDELRRIDPVTETREQELTFITARLPGLLDRSKLKLSRMSTLTEKVISAASAGAHLNRD